jgi:8-oxo-dGTP pyrophosphatase MutT (NUDIX family)
MPNHQKIVVSGLVWANGKVLLLHRDKNFKELATGKGLWDLPGGKLEAGEGLMDSLWRELGEETGIQQQAVEASLATVLAYKVTDGVYSTHRVNILYALNIGETPAIKLSDEHDSYQWIGDQATLKQMEMLPAVKVFLAQLLPAKEAAARAA